MTHGGQNFSLGPTYSDQPLRRIQLGVAEQRSALGKVAVRQAISYGINRSHLIQVLGGPS